MMIASQQTKKMNQTPTLLTMTVTVTVTVVTVTMNCTPDYPKHSALNSLHDIGPL